MFGRGTLVIMLAAALGLPYMLSSSGPVRHRISNLMSSVSDTDEHSVAVASDAAPSSGAAAAAGGAPATPSAGVPDYAPQIGSNPVVGVADAFRFNITIPWVLANWSRVSTRLAETQLQGYRVSLVTGTRPDDLAGSLTYYFNPQQHLVKITFFGTTGDPNKLANHLQQTQGFVRELTNEPQLFIYRVMEDGEVLSELRIRPVRVITESSPHARFEVALAMRRPADLD